jgi:hypothetical protein
MNDTTATMDPNATLAEIRNIVTDWAQNGTDGEDAMQEMAESFGALDEWLTKGGFLPDAWKR